MSSDGLAEITSKGIRAAATSGSSVPTQRNARGWYSNIGNNWTALRKAALEAARSNATNAFCGPNTGAAGQVRTKHRNTRASPKTMLAWSAGWAWPANTESASAQPDSSAQRTFPVRATRNGPATTNGTHAVASKMLSCATARKLK